MRKFGHQMAMDSVTFAPKHLLYLMNDETANYEVIASENVRWKPKEKYTQKQLDIIEFVNSTLMSRNEPLLTDEEITHMLDPTGAWDSFADLGEKIQTPADLQRLAGFTVEKKIIRHND